MTQTARLLITIALAASVTAPPALAATPAAAVGGVSLELALAQGHAAQVVDRAGHLARMAGASRPDERADMLNLLGRALLAIGDLEGAAAALDASLDALAGTPHVNPLIDNLVARGDVAQRRGLSGQAKLLLEEAAQWAAVASDRGRRMAWVRARLALATDDASHVVSATHALDAACLETDAMCSGLRALLEARTAMRHADAAKARHVLATAEQALARAGLDGLRLSALTELIPVHRRLGLARQARAACEVGLAVARRTGHRSFAPHLHRERAELALETSDTRTARRHLESALAEESIAPVGERAATRVALANLEVASGQYADARRHLETALSTCTGDARIASCRATWRGLAVVAAAEGDHGNEETWLLKLAEAAPAGEELWRVWDRLGQLASTRGDTHAATERLGRAVDALEVEDAMRAPRLDPERFREGRLRVYDRLLSAWLERTEKTEEPVMMQALAVAERSEARSFLDLIERARLRHARPEVAELLGQVDHIDREVAGLASDRAAADTTNAQRILALNQKRALLEVRLHETAPRLARLDPGAVRSRVVQAIHRVQRDVTDEAIILKYHLAPRRSWLFVIGSAGVQVLPISGREVIAPLATAFHESLTRPARAKAGRAQRHELAQALFKELLEPALAHIGTRTRVVVAPHAELRVVPFDALVLDAATAAALPALDRARPRFALERFTFSQVPSITALAELHADARRRERRTDRHPFVGFADPVYARTGAPIALPHLSWSRTETRQALDHLGGLDGPGTLFLGQAATEAALKGLALNRYRIVHIATHGWAGDAVDAGRTPSLFLGPGSGDDGRLELDEVIGLRMDADLVVLSACESGRGPLTRGDGLGGLTGAFLHAGASAVMATLWAVEDAHAARLMDTFYGGLSAGVPAADALRSARLAMLSKHKSRRGGVARGIGGILDPSEQQPPSRKTRRRARTTTTLDPFFWASYVLVGDSGDIIRTRD